MSAICRVLGISMLELLTFEEQQATRKLFEEEAAALRSIQPAKGIPRDQSSRISEFEKHLYDMYIARTGT